MVHILRCTASTFVTLPVLLCCAVGVVGRASDIGSDTTQHEHGTTASAGLSQHRYLALPATATTPKHQQHHHQQNTQQHTPYPSAYLPLLVPFRILLGLNSHRLSLRLSICLSRSCRPLAFPIFASQAFSLLRRVNNHRARQHAAILSDNTPTVAPCYFVSAPT